MSVAALYPSPHLTLAGCHRKLGDMGRAREHLESASNRILRWLPTEPRPRAVTATSMFGSSFAQVAGATLLLSAADRLPPRAALALIGLAFGLGNLGLAVPGLPLVGAALAGLIAQHVPPGPAMAVMGAASLLVTVALTRALRLSDPTRLSGAGDGGRLGVPGGGVPPETVCGG